MFETVLGIPAHPLLVHAVVVFVPLLILAALCYALIATLRPRIEWVLVGLLVVAPGSALLAKLAGDAFVRRLIRRHEISAQILAKIQVHRSYGTTTLYLSIALAAVAVGVILWQRMIGRRTGASGKNDQLWWYLLVGATIVLSVVTGFYVFKTGDTGAHIVWQGF